VKLQEGTVSQEHSFLVIASLPTFPFCKSSHIAHTLLSLLHAYTNHLQFLLLFAATPHPVILQERGQVGGATQDDVSQHCESEQL